MNQTLAFSLVIIIIVGVVAFVLGSGNRTPETGILMPTTDSVVALGETIYDLNCASCHGANLEGQPEWKSLNANGRLPAPPHDETGHTWHHDSVTLVRLTKYGTGALIGDPNYESDMPIFDGVLTDAEIVAVLSYIKSTWPQEIRERHNKMEDRK